MENLQTIFQTIKIHQDNPNELSKIGIYLAGLLYTKSTDLAESQKKYAEAVIKYLDATESDENGKIKKMSVAEAERRADVDTDCEHDKTRNEFQSIIEIINMLKVRVKVLSGEKDISDKM